MTGFVNPQRVLAAAPSTWPSLVMTSPETMTSVQCLQRASRHGNGRLAHGDDMNASGDRQRLAADDEALVMPIEHVAHRTRRLDRLQRGEEQLANPGACQFEVRVT